MYAGFTAFVVLALRRGGVLSSCGCFGRADTPPDPGPRAGDRRGSGGRACSWPSTRPAPAPWSVPWPTSGAGAVVGLVALVALVGFLAWQVMAVLPTVAARCARLRSGRPREGLSVLAVVIAEGVAIALLAVLVLGPAAQPRTHPQGPARARAPASSSSEEAALPVTTARRAGRSPCRSSRASCRARGPSRARRTTSWAPTSRGARRRRARRRVGPPTTLLAFLTSGCSVCLTFWEELGPDTATPGDARLVVVAKGTRDDSPSVPSRGSPGPECEVVASSAAWADYDIPGSPYFVLVEGGVVTGEGSATSWPAVRDLLQQAVEESAHARAAAGRTGPGAAFAGVVGAVGAGSGREDLRRIDAELLAAGIRPGSPEPVRARRPRRGPRGPRPPRPRPERSRPRPPRPGEHQ